MTQSVEAIKRSVAAFYQTYGKDFSATRRGTWDVMRLILEVLRPGDTLVDVGAGNARLAREVPSSVRYIGIEPSETMRAEAQRFVAQRKEGDLRAGGFPRLPVGDAEADAVACIAVLHHLTPAERFPAIAELHRILRPGGVLILTVWNLRCRRFARLSTLAAAWFQWSLVAGGGPGDLWMPWQGGSDEAKRYVHCFTPVELRSYFDAEHWHMERCEPWARGQTASVWNGPNLVVVARKKIPPKREEERPY